MFLEYFEARKNIFDYFSLPEILVPIVDYREYFWRVHEGLVSLAKDEELVYSAPDMVYTRGRRFASDLHTDFIFPGPIPHTLLYLDNGFEIMAIVNTNKRRE